MNGSVAAAARWPSPRYLLLLLVLALNATGCAPAHGQFAIHHSAAVDRKLGSGIEPVQLLIEPDAGVRGVVRAIDQAQLRIFVETYILSDRRIVRALERAAAQGVDVYVMLERHPLGMGTQPARMADLLRAAGVRVRWSRPGFQLTHAKFMVLDDRLAIISTGNYSRASFWGDRDVVVLDRTGADVRESSAIFRADWDRLPPTLNAPDLLVAPDNARGKLLALLARERRSIDAYGEEIGDPQIERVLISTAHRGSRVRLILPPGASPRNARRLLSGGVQVRELRSPYVHAKVLMIDGREAYLGSENFSTASLDANRELGVLIRGRDVSELETTFRRDWSHARRVAQAP